MTLDPSLLKIPVRRQTFFSFHHGNDIDRVNKVRGTWEAYKHAGYTHNFTDRSLHEAVKTESETYTKQRIREQLKHTTVTCVLAGSQTWQRPYVRYEIAQSMLKQNALLTVYVHQLGATVFDYRDVAGPDPLDFMGVAKSPTSGNIVMAEKAGHTWRIYSEAPGNVLLPVHWQRPQNPGDVIPLSAYSARYDYISDNGPLNFVAWIHEAALTRSAAAALIGAPPRRTSA